MQLRKEWNKNNTQKIYKFMENNFCKNTNNSVDRIRRTRKTITVQYTNPNHFLNLFFGKVQFFFPKYCFITRF